MVAEQVQPRPHGGEDFVQHRFSRVDVPPRRIERPRRLVRQEDVDARERLAGQDFILHEVPALVVAPLAQLDEGGRRLVSPGRRQGRGRRVVPTRRERASQRRHAPAAHLMERAVAQVVQRRRGRTAGRRLGHDVEVLVVALDPVEGRGRREVLALVAGDVAHLQPERHVRVPAHDVLNGLELAVDVAERADHHDRRERTDRTAEAGEPGGAGKPGGSDEAIIVFACPADLALPSLPLSGLLFGVGGRHEEVGLVPDELVLAVHGQLVVLAHEDGADGARFFTVAAENAARLVYLVHRGVARARLDAAGVFLGLEVDGVGRAGDRAQAAGDAFLQIVLVAHQHLFAAVFREHRDLLVRVVHRHGLLENVLERGEEADEERPNDTHCSQFTRPIRSM